jgi:hypothetical protein
MSDTQTFKLYGPSGDVIMTGSMNAIMERLPDTHARNDALSTMLDTAVKQVEAEEKLEDARACAAKILSDGVTRLASRLDAFEKQRALSMKRAEAQRKARDAARVQRYLDELPDPDAPEPTAASDDDPLTSHGPVDPEKYGPANDEAPGDLPRQLERETPPLSGSYTEPKPDPLGGPEDPKQVQQPISASLW